MIRKCIVYDDYLSNKSQYNTYHVHELDPYEYDETKDQMIVDTQWFNRLSEFTQKKILEQNVELGIVKIPHPYVKTKQELEIFRAHFDGYDYHLWYDPEIPNGPKNVRIIEITPSIKKAIHDAITRHSNRLPAINDDPGLKELYEIGMISVALIAIRVKVCPYIVRFWRRILVVFIVITVCSNEMFITQHIKITI